MIKESTWQIQGMQRDLSVSKFNPLFAYENKNVRLAATDEGNLLSLVNEKGPKKIDINGIESIEGTVLGTAVLDNSLVIFTHGDTDIIYRILFGDTISGEVLFRGDLKFNLNNPIETLGVYENEDILKIYWTDGINQPRVININADLETKNKWIDSTSFDFVRALNLNETIDIKRNIVSTGVLAPGTILYVFTYYNVHGQETNVFYASSLHYISYNNRGASPEDKVSNSFSIKIENPDTNFEYVRIYSILRTSIDATPTVKRVIDLPIDANGSPIYYTDNGEAGAYEDPTILLYIGGKKITAGTISLKDNTLFLGDIKLDNKVSDLSTISKKVKDLHLIDSFHFEADKNIYEPLYTGSYPYTNHLSSSRDKISTFKYGERYRFGILLQTSTGEWSEPIWIGDKTNDKIINLGNKNITNRDNYLISGNLTIDSELLNLIKKDYIRIRPIVVYPNIAERNVICLGVLNPTVFNVIDRNSNSPYALSSWFFRPNIPSKLKQSSVGVSTYTEYLGLATELAAAGSIGSDYTLNITIGENTKTYHIILKGWSYDGKPANELGLPSRCGIAIFTPISASMEEIIVNLDQAMASSSYSVVLYNTNPVLGYSQLSVSDNIGANPNFYIKGGKDKETITINNTLSNNKATSNITGYSYSVDIVASGIIDNLGEPLECRHYYPLPSNTNRNCEIQCNIDRGITSPFITESEKNTFLTKNSDVFFVDLSILTFHSPDIEYGDDIRGLESSKLQLKIVGYVPITGTISDIDVLTSTPPMSYRAKDVNLRTVARGFYKENVGESNISRDGYLGLVTSTCWIDEIYSSEENYGNDKKKTTAWPVYPWHRNGSLNNLSYASKEPGASELASDNYRSAMLKYKKMSNLRFSYKPYYLEGDKMVNYSISGISVFDSDLLTNIRLDSLVEGLSGINYYGNIDRIISNIQSYTIDNGTWELSDAGDNVLTGYRLARGGNYFNADDAHRMFSSELKALDKTEGLGYGFTKAITNYRDCISTDPIRMKYKSGIHAVLALDYFNGDMLILPTMKDEDGSELNKWVNKSNQLPFWLKSKINVRQDVIDERTSYGWLWLADLINPNVSNESRFGGTSEDAIKNNSWLPCGEAINIKDLESITLKWTEGDTFFLRYDVLKTYPFTMEDLNSIVDILSFMCETRINVDGRYDLNSGLVNNLYMTPTIFNKMNPVYSLKNNFFQYRVLRDERYNVLNFPNIVTWTKTKTYGELTDTWVNVTLASTLDLDGDMGPVRALRRFNNNLIAFQDMGISLILYNENVLIASTEGVPIEIANSGKVSGKRYISDKIGCKNKWSIQETPNGIYFIDGISKGIYVFNGQLGNISDKCGFHSWINELSTTDIWDPKNNKGFVTHYDKINGDVLFTNSNYCLAFSEPLGLFSSFYSYENTHYFLNIIDSGVWIKNNYLWLHNKGDYNYFFEEYRPFYTTVIANPDMLRDKIFNNIEFRADSWNKDGELLNTTFDTLDVWNEYLYGTLSLFDTLDRPSSLKKKFRVWRANIPRDNKNHRDRIRNPWAYIKLSMNKENTDKTVLHDMVIKYFE